MLTWPHEHGDWHSKLSTVEPVFVEIARCVSLHEHVVIACWDETHLAHVRMLLKDSGAALDNITLHATPSNDTWARDHGPITVFDNTAPRLLDFTFNGWGRKFDAELDNQLTERLHAAGAFGKTPLQTVDLVLEGGSIEVDGAGTLLTTRRCLMSPMRNPHLTQPQIEALLGELFDVERFLWLDNGYLAGDDTDSHIDTLARLCDRRTIAYVACDDPADEHYQELKAMEDELKRFRTADGAPYRLVALPWPRPNMTKTDIACPPPTPTS